MAKGHVTRITFQGQTLTIKQWSLQTGIPLATLHKRLQAGWLVERILETPNQYHDGFAAAHPAEYDAWSELRRRCTDPNRQNYEWYGGLGIKVCQGWDTSFFAFFQAVGAKPSPKHTIDRRENTGHYSCGQCAECLANGWPMNCRWLTMKEQTLNRRSNHRLTHDGLTLTISQWAERTGLKWETIYQRVCVRNWTVEQALTKPVAATRSEQHKNRKHKHDFTHDGVTLSLRQWADRTGISYPLLYRRIMKYGWSLERALTEPVDLKLSGPRGKRKPTLE